jgi:cation transport ATPase
MKKTILALLLSLFITAPAFADSYELKIDQIHCEKCVQKIHDYFTKTFKDRVQNLKIDEKSDTIAFDSISVDAGEFETIQKDLEKMGYKVTDSKVTKHSVEV